MSRATEVVLVDDLAVDLTRRRVSRRGEPIALSALSFDTLAALVAAAPAPLATDELVQRAWNGTAVADETVTQRIKLLREALGDDARRPRYIETLRGVGYRLVPLPQPASAGSGRKRRWPWFVGLAAAALLVIVLLWRGRTDEAAAEAGRHELPTTGPVTAGELIERSREYMAERQPQSMRYAIDLLEQAVEMEPGNSEARSRLALALALGVAWFNFDMEDTLRAETLAREELAVRPSFGAQFALALSLDAQGRSTEALEAYEAAVALDPEDRGARASLAYLLQERGRLVEALSHDIAVLRSGPSMGELEVQIASCLRLLDFQEAASQWLARADRLQPGGVHAATARAQDLIARGDLDLAGRVVDEALARGVEQPELYEYGTLLALARGDLPAARAVLDSVPPELEWRASITVWRLVVRTLSGDASETEIASQVEEMRRSIQVGDDWTENHLYLAMVHAAAGQDDAALAALEDLREAGYLDYRWLQVLPLFKRLHARREFRELVDRMRADVERQRQQVVTASWFPEDLLESEPAR